jgi:iron complex outermembrane receptor protein
VSALQCFRPIGFRRALLIGTSLGTLTTAQIANAQTSTGQADQPSANAPALEEIVVTAQKKEEKLQDVPMTINAIGGKTLEQLDLLQFSDIVSLTPGLQITNQGGGNVAINLRGVSFNGFTGAQPTVDVYFNEIPITGAVAFNGNYDLQDIEVLRGPQGTLRGRTSPSGAITVNTRMPSLSDYNGQAIQTFSDQGAINSQLAVGIPIVADKLAIRIAGLYDLNYGLQGQSLLSGKDEQSQTRSLRESILWEPTDDLKVSLVHEDLTNRYNNFMQLAGTLPVSVSNPYNGVTIPAGTVISPDQRANLAVFNSDNTERADISVLTAKWDLTDNFSINYIGGYFFENRISGGPGQTYGATSTDDSAASGELPPQILAASPLHGGTTWHQTSQEVRFESSGNDFWNYGFGAYYDFYKTKTVNGLGCCTLSFPTSGAIPQNPNPVAIVSTPFQIPTTNRDYAFFTQQTFNITDNDQIQLGARWTRYEAYENFYLGISAFVPSIHATFPVQATMSELFPQNVRRDYDGTTGSASYTHHFDDDLMVYAEWAHGFRPGGNNVGSTNPGTAQSLLIFGTEKSDLFEIGTKDSFFEHRLNVDVDVYHQQYHGFIGQTTDGTIYWRPGNSGPATNTIPANTFNGNGHVNGIEATFTGLITDNWTAMLTAAYADSQYSDARAPCNDQNGSGSPNNAPAGATRNIQGTGQVSYCNINGSLTGAAPWGMTLTTEYDVPDLFYGLTGFGRLLEAFTPAYQVLGAFNSNKPDFATSIYLGVRAPDSQWELQMFVKNLFDYQAITESPIDASVSNVYDSGLRSVTDLAPREIGFTARYNFSSGGSAPAETAAYVPPQAVAPAPSVPRSYLVFFDFNKSDLTPQAVQIVNQAASNAGPAKVTQLTVTGHTDTVGSDAYNMRLSRRRAESVAAQLEKDGIASSEISIVAKGKRDLLVPTADGVKEPQNRRVQIVYDGGVTS